MSNGRDLTEGPVWRRLLDLAGPMVFGIVAVLSIALADTYYVGQLGKDQLAALSYTFPVSLTLTSLAIGLGAGASSVVSRAIGGGGKQEARRLTTDSLVLAVIIVVIMSGLGVATINPLFTALGAKGRVLDLVGDYMVIWYFSMPFLVIPMVANAVIRAVGDALWPSMIMIAAAVINIGITPLFVFGAGPIPALEVEGAAWGTAIARAITLVLALGLVIFREKLVSFSIPSMEELWSSWRRVLKIGAPAAAANMVNPIGIGIVTAILATFGDTVVAAYGVASRLETYFAIPMLALSAAMNPLAGQNWGASKPDRVIRALKTSYAVCAGWTLLISLFLFFAADPLVTIFNEDTEVRDEAALYLKIIPISLWGYGIVIVAAAGFNAIGRAVTGFGYYALRSLVLIAPLSWLAAHLAGTREVYIAMAISNALSGAAVAAYSLWKVGRLKDRVCPDPGETEAVPAE